MSEIQLENVTKQYGDLIAVDGIDVTIPDGSYTMILGPSGCGKSTTLRMIAGLETPSDGVIRFGDERVTDKPPRHRDLTMVFQNLALWDHKTVRENIEFGLKMEGVDSDERHSQSREIAEILQIEDKLDQSPTELSGGQQQRVALGRSLVREPEVVLLDEPLSSLDAKLRIEMRTELLRIQRRTGISFVHVTHSQEDAMSIADEILLLEDGELQQFGDPIDLFEDPANRFVADFIGTPSMNLFNATFDSDTACLETAGFDLELPTEIAETYANHVPATDIEVGIRPSNLKVLDRTGSPSREAVGGSANGSVSADGGEGSPRFEAEVSVVETYGDNNWYYLDADLTEELVMKSADETVLRSVEAGDTVTVEVRPDDIHLFDSETGESLL